MEYVAAVGRDPRPGGVEYRYFNAAHQHDVEHAVVGNENVRWLVLHVPARPHLCAIQLWEEAGSVWVKPDSIGVGLDGPEFLPQLCFLAGGPVAWNRGPAC